MIIGIEAFNMDIVTGYSVFINHMNIQLVKGN